MSFEKHLRSDCGPEAATTKITADRSKQDTATAFLRLLWIGRQSSQFRTKILDVIVKGFPRVRTRVVFTTSKVFSGRGRDVLPTTSLSDVVYEFTCRCNRTYVGKTSQILGERIRQHIPERLFVNLHGKPAVRASSDSAITKHLIANADCINENIRWNFSILARAQHWQHLDVLEAIYIKSPSPGLC